VEPFHCSFHHKENFSSFTVHPCAIGIEPADVPRSLEWPLSSPDLNQLQLQRGKMPVAMAWKRKSLKEHSKSLSKVWRQATQSIVAKKVPKCCHPSFKELNRELLVVDEENEIGTWSFGTCYPGVYREEFNVLVKVIKPKDSSFSDSQRGNGPSEKSFMRPPWIAYRWSPRESLIYLVYALESRLFVLCYSYILSKAISPTSPKPLDLASLLQRPIV